MGNIDLVQRVLDKFQQRLPEDLAELEQAFEHGNAEQVARTAHRLKGSSATMSAGGLTSAAADVEDASRHGRMAEVPVGIARLRDECRKLAELSVHGVVGR
jgi:HPt (histidine-containing phosphotransfer) domain-containing protein